MLLRAIGVSVLRIFAYFQAHFKIISSDVAVFGSRTISRKS
jgi:hypothetical protein